MEIYAKLSVPLKFAPHLEVDSKQLLETHRDEDRRDSSLYTVMNILQAPTVSSFIKSDRIAEAFTSLDAKLNYIKEQQRLLASLKKQLELAKSYDFFSIRLSKGLILHNWFTEHPVI